MASRALKDFKCTTWRQRTTRREAHLKSFNARLAVDYPAYSIVICQIKTCLALCSAIFDRKGKNDGYFVSYGSIALAFCPLQIRHRDEIVW